MSDVANETPAPEEDVPVEETPEEEAPAEEVAPDPEPTPDLNLSAGVDLPTSDGFAPDQVEVTDAVTSEKKKFIVWDAKALQFVAGPFDTSEDAQIFIDFTSAKDSRSTNYVAPSYSIESVTDANA